MTGLICRRTPCSPIHLHIQAKSFYLGKCPKHRCVAKHLEEQQTITLNWALLLCIRDSNMFWCLNIEFLHDIEDVLMTSVLCGEVWRGSTSRSASEVADMANRTFFNSPPQQVWTYALTAPRWCWVDALRPEISSCTVWQRALGSRAACDCAQTALYVLIWKTRSQLSWLQFALISSQDLLFSLGPVNDMSLQSETTEDLFALRDTEEDA